MVAFVVVAATMIAVVAIVVFATGSSINTVLVEAQQKLQANNNNKKSRSSIRRGFDNKVSVGIDNNNNNNNNNIGNDKSSSMRRRRRSLFAKHVDEVAVDDDGRESFIGTWKASNLSPYETANPRKPEEEIIVIDENVINVVNRPESFANGNYNVDTITDDVADQQQEIIRKVGQGNNNESITFKISGAQNNLLSVTFAGGSYDDDDGEEEPSQIIYVPMIITDGSNNSESDPIAADDLRRFYTGLQGTWFIESEQRRNPASNDEDLIVIDRDEIRYIYCGGGIGNGPYLEHYDSLSRRISKRKNDVVNITYDVFEDDETDGEQKLRVTYSYYAKNDGYSVNVNPVVDVVIYDKEEEDYYYYIDEGDGKQYPVCDYTLPPAQQQPTDNNNNNDPNPTPNPNSPVNNRKCTDDDIELYHQVGDTDYPITAVEKISTQNSTSSLPKTVTVQLNQRWYGDDATTKSSSIDRIYTYYHESMFEKHCFESTDVEPGDDFDTITISCNVLKPTAQLKICVADSLDKGVLTTDDDAEVPECCHPTFPPGTPVVCYDLEIGCLPCENYYTNPTSEPLPTFPPIVAETVTEPLT